MDNHQLTLIVPLLAGYVLDLLLGDPRWLPHPVRLYGNIIAYCERLLNCRHHRFLKGMLLTLSLCLANYLFFLKTSTILLINSPYFYYPFTTIFIFYALANKSLLEEGKEVFEALSKGIESGRKRLSWIVGRETANLDENQIRTAVFETLSENLNDGVIAPLFYYAIAGLPGMMTYKLVNTLDSMIGYKHERYFYFGKFAARLDDVLNYLPARITALLIALVTFNKKSLFFIFRYGHKHASPNSGYPEAAMAGFLNCRFGGPNVYHGSVVAKPFIGDNSRIINDNEFSKVAYVNHAVTLLFVVLTVAWIYLFAHG